MKLRELKEMVNGLSEQELEMDLVYNSIEYSLSGIIAKVEKVEHDLYTSGEDDPSPLYTKKQLKNVLGYDKEEIEECDIELPKGCIVFVL